MAELSRRRLPEKEQPEQLILRGSVRRDGLGFMLLAASVSGVILNGMIFPPWGRIGGILQQVSTGILFGRITQFIGSGVPQSQRNFPRVLTYMELVADGTATLIGFRAWLWRPLLGHNRWSAASSFRAARVSRVAAVLSFVIHTARVAIYLSPARGLNGSEPT